MIRRSALMATACLFVASSFAFGQSLKIENGAGETLTFHYKPAAAGVMDFKSVKLASGGSHSVSVAESDPYYVFVDSENGDVFSSGGTANLRAYASQGKTVDISRGIAAKGDGRGNIRNYKHFSLSGAGRASGMPRDETESLARSRWGSTYVVGNQSVNVTIEFNKRSGSFSGNNSGSLKSIVYYETDNANSWLVTGTWESGNSRGPFQFRVNGNSFRGSWRKSNEANWSSWNGTRLGGG
ncbi:hypothetical protein Enr13x_37920 [Stieleria neptunia]|uniref:Uncharacterized protein n=1 Tax=Stieleria neptunia TaxID=2527979 RepID=A0A518HSW5_9BACT|nr:hypothetical protein [Stieleria neptunia]QDV43932.1 hypothetical protein Enr13x_37920 [Stieleria neptunia]